MPYFDCTVCNTYPIRCLTSNAIHFQCSRFRLQDCLTPAIVTTLSSLVIYMYGNRLLSGHHYRNESERRQRVNNYTRGSLIMTLSSLIISILWLSQDVCWTRFTPFGPDNEIHNVLAQTFILVDVAAGACCSVTLIPRSRKKLCPGADEYDPEVSLLLASPGTPRAIWRSQRMLKRGLMSIWMAGLAEIFTGELVMRLLAGYVFGKALGDFIECCLPRSKDSMDSAHGRPDVSTIISK